MFLRPSSFLSTASSWKRLTILSSNIDRSLLHHPHRHPQLLVPASDKLESQRTFLFWRANIQRELYGTPKKAAATRRVRRLQKTFAELIRDGQFWRFMKESFLPEWKKWWSEVYLFDRRYVRLNLQPHSL